MIYLDGTKFFFDIEGCFSNLVQKAREESKNSEPDKKAGELCGGFAKFFGTKTEFVKAGKIIKPFLKGFFPEEKPLFRNLIFLRKIIFLRLIPSLFL